MADKKTDLHDRIDSGKPILVVEWAPPLGADPGPVENAANRFAGKVHALGVSDNRDRVGMSALAAAVLLKKAGVEPILHVVTRDRNRIALVSDFLGAQALGLLNVFCTSGSHQALGQARAARNVFDVDSIQLIRTYANLATDGRLVGEAGIDGCGPVCLGAAASPFADPVELQLVRLVKKVAAGARFLITDPLFDLQRFDPWWKAVTDRGLHERVAILAGIHLLTDAEAAKAYADRRPDPMLPETVLPRIASAGNKTAQRAAGIEMARETVDRLSGVTGLRGLAIRADRDEDALELIEKAGLGTE